jgi:O-antigen/teichoic acid export membrane protein
VAAQVGRLQFGYYAIYLSILTFATVFSTVGLSNAVNRYVADAVGRQGTVSRGSLLFQLKLSLSIGLFSSVALVVLADQIAASAYGDRQAVVAVYSAAALAPIYSVAAVLSGALSGIGKYVEIAKVQVIATLMSVVVTFGLVPYFGITGFIVSVFLTQAILLWHGWLVIRGVMPRDSLNHSGEIRRQEFFSLIRFGLPTTASALAVTGANWYVVSVLARNEGLADVAVYNVALQWRTAILFIPATLGPMLLARFTTMQAQKADGRSSVLKLSVAVFSTGVVCLALIAVGSGELLRMYGPEFSGENRLFVVVIASAAILVVNNTVSKYVMACGESLQAALHDVIWAVSFLVLSLYMLDSYGTMGVGYSALVAAVLQLAVQFLAVWRMEDKS